MEKLFFGQNQCPSLFWIRVTSLNAMGRFFLPNFVLLSFGCFNSIGFVGYLFVTEMMNCFVEPFPRFLDWFDVAANSVHPLSPICVVCLAQKLFLSLTSAFPVPFLISLRPRKQQMFSLLCHAWCCLLKLENCFSSLFLSDPSPIIGYACHSLTHSLTDSVTLSKLD